TFSKAGAYTLEVAIKDNSGLTATSQVSVTVNAVLSAIGVTPASASVAASGMLAFNASASDQFGAALASQPAFTWAVSGVGAVNSAGLFVAGATAGGPYNLTAVSAGTTGTA